MKTQTIQDIAENAVLTMAMQGGIDPESDAKRVGSLSNMINTALWSERNHLAEVIEDLPLMEQLADVVDSEALCNLIAEKIRDRNHTNRVPYDPAAMRAEESLIVETYIPHLIFSIDARHVILDCVCVNPDDTFSVAGLVGADYRKLAGVMDLSSLEAVVNDVFTNQERIHQVSVASTGSGELRQYRCRVQMNTLRTHVVLTAHLRVMKAGRMNPSRVVAVV